MQEKKILRKKFLQLRKKKYYEINKEFFIPLLKLIKSKFKKKKLKLALYYPSNYEVNTLKILENNKLLKLDIFLPVVGEKGQINFSPWKKNQVLRVNRFGMLEPFKSKVCVPNVMLVPTLAYDHKKYRLGYGKGFYDRYLNKYSKKFNNILTVGVAFSFQKYHKLPINKNDVKLDYILTENGLY